MSNLESLFDQLHTVANSGLLPFLVIGGHAVNGYGYARTTLDLDLLIPENQTAGWIKWAADNGYKLHQKTESFIQFRVSQAEPALFPLDLMVVSPETFDKLYQNRQSLAFGKSILPAPDPRHLIALKLHAMKNVARRNLGKDLPDIIQIMKHCHIEVDDPVLLGILDKYGTGEIKSQIFKSFSHE